jgi:hypothetical protein
MFQIAKISFDAGALLLPANDPYDREVVFEEADFYARRHGSVDLQIGPSAMRAACSAEPPGMLCAHCHEPVRAVTFHVGERRFCTQCVKRAARRVDQLFHPPH